MFTDLETAAKMSPIGFGNTFGIASEFTNEIYDISNDANQAAVKEGGDTWTMVLGIVVTLLPKVNGFSFDKGILAIFNLKFYFSNLKDNITNSLAI